MFGWLVLPVLINQLLDLFVFFLGVFLGKRLVVLGDQFLYLLAVDLHHVVGLNFRGLYPALAVYTVVFLALDVGVVALPFVVLHVVISGVANELANLIFGERRTRVGGLRNSARLGKGQGRKKSCEKREFEQHAHNYAIRTRVGPKYCAAKS